MLLLMLQVACYDFLLLCREVRQDLWPWVNHPTKIYKDLLERSLVRAGSEMEALRSACSSASAPSGPRA
jgi:hypothetical protein